MMIDWEHVQWGSVAQWSSAIASAAAVIVALFKEPLLAWRKRPKLLLRVNQGPPDVDKIPIVYNVPGAPPGFPPLKDQADCYFLRLWVQNEGKSRAEKVQVFVARLLRSTANGEFVPLESFLPMNLRWGFGSETPSHSEVFADGISPGMGVHCNLGHITNPAKRKALGEDHPDVAPEQTILQLETEMKPTNRCYILPPGHAYRLELLVAAANCRPVSYIVEVTITGKWFDDQTQMLRDGVRTRIIKKN